MTTPDSPEWYIITLKDLQPRAAVRRFKNSIKEHWNHSCALRKSMTNVAIAEHVLDHILPRSSGKNDRPIWLLLLNASDKKSGLPRLVEGNRPLLRRAARKVKSLDAADNHNWTIGEALNGSLTSATVSVEASRDERAISQRRARRCLSGLLGATLQAEAGVHGIQ